MTFLDAAIYILKQHTVSLSPKEIWEEIEKQSLMITAGKTPWATLDTTLRLYMKDSKISSNELRIKNPKQLIYFEGTGKPVKFKLINAGNSAAIPTTPSVVSAVIPPVVSVITPTIVSLPTQNGTQLYQITDQSLNWKLISVVNNNGHLIFTEAICSEYTYIIEDAAGTSAKIGKTKGNPEARLDQLRTANPGIKVKHVFPATIYSEASLHSKFQDSHKELEWYFLTPPLKTFIAQEKNKHAIMMKAYAQSLEYDKVVAQVLSTKW